MLRLVKPMVKLGNEDDERVQRLFDEVVHSDVDRVAKQVENIAFGMTLEQLIGDGFRVTDERRVVEIVQELLASGILVRFEYQNHAPLLFHKKHLRCEPIARETFHLIAA